MDLSIINIVAGVTTPLALLGIVCYFAYAGFTQNQQARWANIATISDSDKRAQAIRDELEHADVKLTDQPLDIQLDEYRAIRLERAKRFRYLLAAATIAFIAIAALTGLWILTNRPETQAERALRDRVASFRAGDISQKVAAENAFWSGDREAKLISLQAAYESDASAQNEEALLKFISEEIASQPNQVSTVSALTDFFYDLVLESRNGTVDLEGACGCFQLAIDDWQRSYYFWLNDRSASLGRPIRQTLADFVLSDCRSFPEETTRCPG